MEVKENEFKGRFTIRTYFKGEVTVRLLTRDGIELAYMDLDIADIFTTANGFTIDSTGICKVTKGNCKTRFAVDQKVSLKEEAL